MITSGLCGPHAARLRGKQSQCLELRSHAFPIVDNSTSFVEGKDSNPGGGNKGKGKSRRGREHG